MKKKIFILLVVLLSVFFLTSCKENNNTTGSAVGYGITHKDYVGFANMTVKNGVVDTVTIDEAYLPNTWAKIVTGDVVPGDILVSGNSWLGKYIIIGDKHFTGTVRDTTLEINGVQYTNQAVKYSADGIDDLFTWLFNSEDNCAWYVTQLQSNNAIVAKGDWTPTTYQSAGRGGFFKSTTNYWPSTSGGLGWQANMNAIADSLKGTKMDATNITKNENGYWTFGDVVSGATLVDFKDYYEVAKRAYAKANNTNNNA